MSVKMVDKDFKSFLLNRYDVSYSSWLCTVEPVKTEMYNGYLQWLTSGVVECSILNFIERTKINEDKTKKFRKWLKKCTKLSYDVFKNLPLDLKYSVYNAYWKDCCINET